MIITDDTSSNQLNPVLQKNETMDAASLTDLANKVSSATKKIEDQDRAISETNNMTKLGFIIALITVGAMVITVAIASVSSIMQVSQQTQLLQEIKDKVSE